MQKTMILGTSGYLGSNLAEYLSSAGHHLIMVSRSKSKLADNDSVDFIKVENYATPIFDEKFKDISAIVYCGGLAHLKKSEATESSETYYHANYRNAVKVAVQAKKNKVRKFIYISTIGVHGRQSVAVISENSKIQADDHYTKSKILAEKKLIDVFSNSPTKLVILRIPMVYGVGAPGNPEISLKYAKRWFLPIKALDQNKRTFLYIENFTSAIKMIIETKKINSTTYCLSDGFSVSTLEYFEIISNLNNVILKSFRFPRLIYELFQRIFAVPILTSIVTDMQVSNKKFCDHFVWVPPYSSKAAVLTQRDKEMCDE